MSIKISKKDWEDKTFRDVVLSVAEILKQEIEIELPKTSFKPYNVQIWRDDDILLEEDFLKKSQAISWIKEALSRDDCKNSYADLKKYNERNDDFDYWFFKLEDNKVVEIDNI